MVYPIFVAGKAMAEEGRSQCAKSSFIRTLRRFLPHLRQYGFAKEVPRKKTSPSVYGDFYEKAYLSDT